ncbi:MAG: molybdate ABC transporter substrate-binding protein [Paenalcaligenes sp.]
MKSYSRIVRALCVSGALSAGLVLGSAAHAGELLVSGAASLTNAFKEVGEAFEKKHSDTKVLNSFAASDVLLQQIVNGAPADVFASADQKAMDKAVEADAIVPDSRADFVRNQVVLIVPNDNPKNVEGLASLANADVTRIAFGNPETVPVGRYTKGALEKAGAWEAVTERQVLGQNVRQVLDYVSRGEVDAGFVFATDAAIMKDKVKVVETLETVTPVTYPIAVVKRDGANPQAQEYVDFILSDEGQEILAKYGFSKP